MNKFLLSIIAVTVIVITGGAFLLTRSEKTLANPTNYEFYWGEGCPHCKNVEDFLASWEKKDQIKIDKLEVQNNRSNADKLIKWGQICKLSQQQIGTVPLLITPKGECYSGDKPIIDFFKSL